jgi:hypothetical protein
MTRNLAAPVAAALILLFACGAGSAVTTKSKKKSTPPKKPAVAVVASKRKTAAGITRKLTPGAKTAGAPMKKTAPARPAITWRNRQMQPTPERYKEIQDALAAKGYLKPEDATGAWTDSSSDALSRFQADQNLDRTGKINALSLIALGLGPKHEPGSAVPLRTEMPATETPGTAR